MIALILTILCSTSIALILKYNNTRRGDTLTLLTGNYFLAALLCFLLMQGSENLKISIQTFIFGIILAALFVFSFFAFSKAVGAAGTALATVSSRLSVIVPIVLSIIIYHEIPGVQQIIGFAFALLTIIFFYFSVKSLSKEHLKMADYIYLLVLLVGIGLNDFAMKVFKQWRLQEEEPFFLFTIFTFSFIYSASYVVLKRVHLKFSTLTLGGILGIPNMFSTFFLLGALARLPAILVYPVINIGIILLTALAAVMIFKECLDRYAILALSTGTIAIVLLSI